MSKSITISDQEYEEFLNFLEEKKKKRTFHPEEITEIPQKEIPRDVIDILSLFHLEDWNRQYLSIPQGTELKFSNETPFLYIVIEGSIQINAFKHENNNGKIEYKTIHYVNGFENKKKYAPVDSRDLPVLGTIRFLIKNSIIYDKLGEYHSSNVCVAYSPAKIIKLTPTEYNQLDTLTPLISKDAVDIILSNNIGAGLKSFSDAKLRFCILEILLDYERHIYTNSNEPYILIARLKKFAENIGLTSATDVDRSLEALEKAKIITAEAKSGKFRTFSLNSSTEHLMSLSGLSKFEWDTFKFSMRPLD